jgi:hypothetical protein
LHVICDNYATHKHERVRARLADHPRITLHFTPTSASWLNLGELAEPRRGVLRHH